MLLVHTILASAKLKLFFQKTLKNANELYMGFYSQHCLAQLFVLLAAAEPKGLKNQEQKNHLTWNLKFWQKSSEVVAE